MTNTIEDTRAELAATLTASINDLEAYLSH